MKHIERDLPEPARVPFGTSPVQKKGPAVQVGRRRAYLVSLLLAAALVGGIGWGLTSMFGTRHNDRVSGQEQAQRLATFSQIKYLAVAAVTQSEFSSALDSMKLSAADRATLVKDVAIPGSLPQKLAGSTPPRNDPAMKAVAVAEKQPLVWITLWDTHAQDGDLVVVQSGGYQQQVMLLNKVTRFAVPLPPNGVLNIVGIHDGGGGITVGAMSGDNPVALPIMSEGQSIGIPVQVR